jgi:hypothetical protein
MTYRGAVVYPGIMWTGPDEFGGIAIFENYFTSLWRHKVISFAHQTN